MKVTQETLPDSQIGLQIEITPEMSKQTYEQVLRKFMGSMTIPGFRKGKVPRQVFLQRVGKTQIKAAALEELVQDAVKQAIQQESIEAIGEDFELKSPIDELLVQFQPGEAFTFTAAVDVPPRVKLAEYKGFSIQVEEVTSDPSKVNQALEDYRMNLATLVPIEDRPAQQGDIAVVDFVGRVKNDAGEMEEFVGGSASDFQVELAEGRFIEGFVDGIIGMTLDETKELSVAFPTDYGQEELAGREAVFTVTVKEIKAKELPDLDDDFAQEISEFETLEELRQSLEERFAKEAEEKTTVNRNQALLEELVNHLDAEIPKTLIRREVNYLVTQTAMQLSNQGLDVSRLLTPEIVQNLRTRTEPEAITRLRRTLALGEVAKMESITVDDATVKARVDDLMADIEDPQTIDIARLNQVIQEELLQEKILDWLAENSSIEFVPEGTLSAKDDEAEANTADPSSDVIDVQSSEVIDAESDSTVEASVTDSDED